MNCIIPVDGTDTPVDGSHTLNFTLYSNYECAQDSDRYRYRDIKKLPSARMRSEGTVVGSVCLCVCYLTSHFSNVRLSHKRYDLPNGQ